MQLYSRIESTHLPLNAPVDITCCHPQSSSRLLSISLIESRADRLERIVTCLFSHWQCLPHRMKAEEASKHPSLTRPIPLIYASSISPFHLSSSCLLAGLSQATYPSYYRFLDPTDLDTGQFHFCSICGCASYFLLCTAFPARLAGAQDKNCQSVINVTRSIVVTPEQCHSQSPPCVTMDCLGRIATAHPRIRP